MNTVRANKINKLQDIQNAFITGYGEKGNEKDETKNLDPDSLSAKKSTIAHS